MNFILGSGSPRRKSILEDIFGTVEIISPSVDESIKEDENAEYYAERIANLKMDAVISLVGEREKYCVITSDTIVVIDGRILGKPESYDDAVSMLRLLSGREHYVLTGLSIGIYRSGKKTRIYGCEKTYVKFKILDDAVISRYLSIINYSDKAGSYAIQDNGEMLVESINGSLTNVIGFPLRLFFSMAGRSAAPDFFF